MLSSPFPLERGDTEFPNFSRFYDIGCLSPMALPDQSFPEHHNFFPSSSRLFAGKAISRLTPQSLMTAKMWRHGIHEFLEIGTPGPDQMLAFIYIDYSMIALASIYFLRFEMFNK